jgi:LEA14-like dessication related protein
MKIPKIVLNSTLALGLFFAARKLFSKFTTAKSLNYNITKVDFNKNDKTFVVFLRLVNPANSSITLNSVVGDVFWNGTNIATIDFRRPTTLNPNEQIVIQLPIRLNLSATTLIFDLLSRGVKFVNGVFEVKGVINAENLVLPLEYKNTLNII